MNTGKNPATERVANDQQPLTKEQFAAFLAKRTALRAKYGPGSVARASILSEFDVTPEEQNFLLNQVLWGLFHTQGENGLSDNELIDQLYGEEVETAAV